MELEPGLIPQEEPDSEKKARAEELWGLLTEALDDAGDMNAKNMDLDSPSSFDPALTKGQVLGIRLENMKGYSQYLEPGAKRYADEHIMEASVYLSHNKASQKDVEK